MSCRRDNSQTVVTAFCGAIGLIAWLAALGILFVTNSLFNLGIGAFGIPWV